MSEEDWIEKTVKKGSISREELRRKVQEEREKAQGAEALRHSLHSLETYAKTPEERKAKERDDVMCIVMETISRYVDNARMFKESRPLPTVNELKLKAETFDEYQLRQSIDESQAWVEKAKKFGETVATEKRKIIGDLVVAGGNARDSFAHLSEHARHEIEEKAENEITNLAKKCQTVQKAIPFFEEVRDIFVHQLEKLNTQKPTEKEVQNAAKRLTKLSKSADKIIAQVEKVIHAVTYDRPTDERLGKAVLLVKSYRVIEQEFAQINKKLEWFGIHVNIGLRSLPILPNAAKKALSHGGE